MKPIKFNDSLIDTEIFMQLKDIVQVLTNNQEFDFDYQYGHQFNIRRNVITASHFWDNFPKEDQVAGYKTDILLRAVGTYQYSDSKSLLSFHEYVKEIKLRKFATELFTLLEDVRLEEICKREKPGTKKWFQKRKELYHYYFHSQLSVNVLKQFELDALFCMIYTVLFSDSLNITYSVSIHEKLVDTMESIKMFLYEVYDASSTKEIKNLTEKIMYRIEAEFEQDVLNQYFIFPYVEHELQNHERNTEFDELKRKDPLQNKDIEEINKKDKETIDETFSTWHREGKNEEEKQTFLQFELEQGTNTNLIGNGAREGSEQDQMMATVQGSSKKTEAKNYEKMLALDKENAEKQTSEGNSPYGESNLYAKHVYKKAAEPTAENIEMYEHYQKEVEFQVQALKKTIEKSIEQKRTNQRKDLHAGRLSKKLLPVVTEEFPRLFYKKHQPSQELDAVFTLLIDCSASMYDKMEDTKKAVILFHEVLKKLRIKHSIAGFWEDANESTAHYQPNYYHEVKTFEESILSVTGASIMQLEPQEDNRDGFSIRMAKELLENQKEKHKFLLVFSDGEPSANQYENNGIVDTYEAVKEARKKGIKVIGLFLSDGEIQEQEEILMKNIYEKEHLMIPKIENLPYQFSQLLKKLLIKMI